MRLFLYCLVLPLAFCHTNTRFKSSSYKLSSDPGVVRYFDSVGGCASHCMINSKISSLTVNISIISTFVLQVVKPSQQNTMLRALL